MAKNSIACQGLLCAVLLLLFSQTVRPDFSVIVAVDSAVPVLEQAEVRAVFLAKRSFVGNGQRVFAVYQAKTRAVYQAFNVMVLGKNNIKMRQYWARLIFAGKGRKLRYLPSDEAVKEYVSTTLGGIGYIDSDAVDDSVKVVFEFELLDIEV